MTVTDGIAAPVEREEEEGLIGVSSPCRPGADPD